MRGHWNANYPKGLIELEFARLLKRATYSDIPFSVYLYLSFSLWNMEFGQIVYRFFLSRLHLWHWASLISTRLSNLLPSELVENGRGREKKERWICLDGNTAVHIHSVFRVRVRWRVWCVRAPLCKLKKRV